MSKFPMFLRELRFNIKSGDHPMKQQREQYWNDALEDSFNTLVNNGWGDVRVFAEQLKKEIQSTDESPFDGALSKTSIIEVIDGLLESQSSRVLRQDKRGGKIREDIIEPQGIPKPDDTATHYNKGKQIPCPDGIPGCAVFHLEGGKK